MKVSVIIPTYNRAQTLAEAIDSVLSQTFKDFELIVVDNYSTDATESVVNAYTDRRIRYFKNQNNGLVSINRNFGIEKSHGEYIAFLDDDDLWLPEKIARQVPLLDSNTELGLVYTDCYIIDVSGTAREKTYFASTKPIRGSVLSELLRNNSVPLSTVISKREVLDKVGVFNPAYRIAQDYDLWLRIAQYYPIDFIEQPLVKYRLHRESVSMKNHLLNYKEDLQIRGNWLKKNPDLKKELGGRCKAVKYWSIFLGTLGNIFRNKSLKSIKESAGLVKYMLLRDNEKE